MAKDAKDEKIQDKNDNIPAEPKKRSRGKVGKLETKIEELELELSNAKDKTLRTHAEYDNYRKRSYRELTDARAAVKADTLEPILNVFDHFQMAVTATETSDNMSIIKEGMKMIATEFAKAMEDFGLEEIDALGKEFDPKLHEAIAKESSEEDENIVIKQWRCGYKLGDKLLRPATVVVSSGPAEDEPEIEESE